MTIDDVNRVRADYKTDGYAIIQYDNGPIHSYPYDTPWLTDTRFGKLYDSIRRNTLVDRLRCYAHYQLVQQSNKVAGDILEVGVWRGGTAGLFVQLVTEKTVYLADTFEGVVKSSAWEHYKDKAHADASEDAVAKFLRQELGANNFQILRGVFPEDTGQKISGKKFAYVHIDVDVYQSAKDTFSFIWGNVAPGGIVVFDDYGFISACAGVYKFVNEIKDDADKIFIHNSNGHAYIIKK